MINVSYLNFIYVYNLSHEGSLSHLIPEVSLVVRAQTDPTGCGLAAATVHRYDGNLPPTRLPFLVGRVQLLLKHVTKGQGGADPLYRLLGVAATQCLKALLENLVVVLYHKVHLNIGVR